MVASGVHFAIVVEVVRRPVLLEALPDAKRLPATLHRTLKGLLSMLQHVILVLMDGFKLLPARLAHAVLHPTAKERQAAVIGCLAKHARIQIKVRC